MTIKTFVSILLLVAFAFTGITLLTFSGCSPIEPEPTVERRTVHDLSPEEFAFWSYTKWAMYQQVYVNISNLINDDTSQSDREVIINREWDRYHKHVESLNSLVFNRK